MGEAKAAAAGGGGWLFRVVLCLAGGAVVTLAIACGSAAWAPSPPVLFGVSRPAVIGWPVEPPTGWFAVSPSGLWDENVWMRRYNGSAQHGTVHYMLRVTQVGWPLRAMQSEYWLANDHAEWPPKAWGKQKGIRTGVRFKNYGDPRLLPTRFLNVGWFVDSTLYGVLLLAVWRGPGFVRRRARAQRGACLRCGYDLRGARRGCPECGAASSL